MWTKWTMRTNPGKPGVSRVQIPLRHVDGAASYMDGTAGTSRPCPQRQNQCHGTAVKCRYSAPLRVRNPRHIQTIAE